MPEYSPCFARVAVAVALMENGHAYATLQLLDESGTKLGVMTKAFTTAHESSWEAVEQTARILGAWIELGDSWAILTAEREGWR